MDRRRSMFDDMTSHGARVIAPSLGGRSERFEGDPPPLLVRLDPWGSSTGQETWLVLHGAHPAETWEEVS